MQHVGLVREDEVGEPLARFDAPGIDARIVSAAPASSAILRFIDPYGDLVVNQRQLPVLIAELQQLADSAADISLRSHIDSVVQFLEESKGVHIYVRFVGD